MSEIQNLLNQVSTIVRKNNEILEATGGRFNIFGVMGVDHYENTHSAIISEFLKPKGSHGLQNQFLNAFINQLKNDFESQLKNLKLETQLNVFNSETAQVIKEFVTPFGRIDILIEDNRGHAIIIENKIYAGDQWDQLSRYNNFAKIKYKEGNYIILYLTLNGTEASEQSRKDINYFQISHKEFIIKWMEKCIQISARYPLVRETIIQYINHLKKLTNQDMEKNFNDELLDILIQKENIQSVFAISNNIGILKNNIIYKYLIPQLNEIANELNLIYLNTQTDDYDFVNTSWSSPFRFKVPKWKRYSIYSEFQATNLQKLEIAYLCDIEHDRDLEILKKIIGTKNNHKTGAFKTFKQFPDWGSDAFVAILNGQMKQAIKFEIEKMIELVNELDL